MNYIKRADELASSDLEQSDKKKEFILMIEEIESTLKHVKGKFGACNFTEDTTQSLPSLPIGKLPVPKYNNIVFNNEINQYELTIGNLKLRGNIGNIYDKRLLLNDRIKVHQVIACKNGNNCRNILQGEYCKFWHDPVDLLILRDSNKITDEFYNKCIKLVRNFTNTSWIYNTGHTTNKHTRLIGSKSSLENDMKLVQISRDYQYCVENMKAQVMHDILVLDAIASELRSS